MNLFKLFKKDKKDDTHKSVGIEEQTIQTTEISEENIASDQGVTIHTMPKRFRNQHLKVSNAKSAGLIIIGSGIIFLIIASVLLYYYLFREKPVEVAQQSSLVNVSTSTEEAGAKFSEAQKQSNQPQQEFSATTTGLTEINEVATSSFPLATSTVVATSTAETASTTGITTNLEVKDSDQDGLTDKEEMLLGSDPNQVDTDGDGYNDLAELLNLYNPLGKDKLIDNPNIGLYRNETYKYSTLYPKSWLQTINGGEDSIMFRSADNHFIQIITQPNSQKQKIQDWYKEQFGVEIIDETAIITGNNWYGITSGDGLIVYLADLKKNYLYTITYNPGESSVLEYKNIFQAMVKSFTPLEKSP